MGTPSFVCGDSEKVVPMPSFFKPIPLYCLDFLPFPLSETVEEPKKGTGHLDKKEAAGTMRGTLPPQGGGKLEA